jgi:hypothetical protein
MSFAVIRHLEHWRHNTLTSRRYFVFARRASAFMMFPACRAIACVHGQPYLSLSITHSIGRAPSLFSYGLRAKAFAIASMPGSRPAMKSSIVSGATMSGASDGTLIGFRTTAPWQSVYGLHPVL